MSKGTRLKELSEKELLTTDEYAEALNIRNEIINSLEKLEFKTGNDYILLKWGTLKGWKLHSEKGKALTEEYCTIGRSMSAMAQEDTERQKQIIGEMIDECNGGIQSDWSGEYFTKKQAKEYLGEK